VKQTRAVTLTMIGVNVLSSACQLDNRVLQVAMDGPVDASSTDSVGAPESDFSPADANDDQSVAACVMPVAGCTSDTAQTCDPVCQTGCTACHEKCSANRGGMLTCNAPLNSRPRGLGEDCKVAFVGAAQTDDCMPGLVCLDDACGSRCYHFCKTDADCFISTCTRLATGSIKVCDVQPVACNPIKNGMPDGCPAGVQACYLSETMTDRTVCDCPFQAGGPNASCSLSRDCFPGLVCVHVTGTGNSICRPVCDLAAGANDCPGGTCTAFNGSKKFGSCN